MSGTANKIEPLRKPVKCPNCGRNSQRDTYPFCSKRCADVDLNRWFAGTYAIAVSDDREDTGEDDR